jgi:hypothetical protein
MEYSLVKKVEVWNKAWDEGNKKRWKKLRKNTCSSMK